VKKIFTVLLALIGAVATVFAQVQDITPSQKTKIESLSAEYSALGSDPVVVQAVKTYNAAPPAEAGIMTQEKWAALSVLSPEIKSISKNDLAAYLKTKRTAVMAELFVSGTDGTKVAFFAKTTSWSHKGKAKHDAPMSGKSWTGSPELDESSGKITVQIAFPVLDGRKPIGSIVIGLDISKL